MIDNLQHHQAVGEAFGYYFDAQGQIVHKVKTIGLQLEDLENKDFIFAVAGGQSKGEAIKAYLSIAPENTVLITDEAAAKSFYNSNKSLILLNIILKEAIIMAIKVTINGFGRIGRLAFRRIQDVEGLEVVAVNDLTDDDMLAHLLKYDTMQGRFTGEVEVIEGGFRVNGKEIKSFDEPDAGKLPWGDLDIDVVLECTGFYTDKEKAQAHIDAGAKKY